MVEGLLALIGLFLLIIIFIIKAFNVTKLGKAYPRIMIFFTFAIALIAWLLVLYSLTGTINTTEQTTITDGSKTWTVTPIKDYGMLSLLLQLSNAFLLLNGMFFVIEILLMFIPKENQPRKARQSNNYFL